MKVKCPECKESHTVSSDYQEHCFGTHCETCNEKAHKKFLKDHPYISKQLKSLG